jgi:hypothetical protein
VTNHFDHLDASKGESIMKPTKEFWILAGVGVLVVCIAIGWRVLYADRVTFDWGKKRLEIAAAIEQQTMAIAEAEKQLQSVEEATSQFDQAMIMFATNLSEVSPDANSEQLLEFSRNLEAERARLKTIIFTGARESIFNASQSLEALSVEIDPESR